jgi:hypothetical protein
VVPASYGFPLRFIDLSCKYDKGLAQDGRYSKEEGIVKQRAHPGVVPLAISKSTPANRLSSEGIEGITVSQLADCRIANPSGLQLG